MATVGPSSSSWSTGAARVEVERAVDPGRRRHVIVAVDHEVGRRIVGHALDGAGGQLPQEALALVTHYEAYTRPLRPRPPRQR